MIIHGDLPPVGHKISLQASTENRLVKFLGGHQYWVDSGTSALALAILDAKTHFPTVQKPRVIIPGYCCPDLVAACVYAGVEPVAVDISENDPAYDLVSLHAQLDEQVIAVIAVNFLGIAERLSELRQLINLLGLRTRLIEDNAQWFPAHEADVPVDSDYTVFSFGRGKPLSLLGGGLLLARTPIATDVAKQIVVADKSSPLLPFKICAYNLLLKPQCYLLLNRNPLLHLGETKYIALEKIQGLDVFRYALLSANFKDYIARKFELKNCYDECVLKLGVQQLSVSAKSRARQMLRYPLLCSSYEHREYLLEMFGKLGLGATALYASSIDQVPGVNARVYVPGALVNAQTFARRFITLPMHAGVTQIYREKIMTILQEAKYSD